MSVAVIFIIDRVTAGRVAESAVDFHMHSTASFDSIIRLALLRFAVFSLFVVTVASSAA